MGRLGEEIVEMKKIINEIPFDAIWVHWETDMYYPILSSNNGYDSSNGYKIFIRTPDKTLNGCEAYIYGSQSVMEIPPGEYTIGKSYVTRTYNGTCSGTYSGTFDGLTQNGTFNDLYIGNMCISGVCDGTYSGTYSVVTKGGRCNGRYSILYDYEIEVDDTPGYISEVRYGGLPLNEYNHSPIPNIGEVEIEWVTNVNNLFPQENSTRGGGYGIYASYSKLDRRDPRIGKYWITNENGDFIYDSDGNVISIE